MQLTPSCISQIQQGGKAGGSERTAKTAHCLVFSALKGVKTKGRWERSLLSRAYRVRGC